MTKNNQELGKWGEDLAYRKLKKLGYKKIIRNYRCAIGELDMIAMDKDTLVFIEIKTRRGRSLGYAKEAITEKKKKKLSSLALTFMKEQGFHDIPARFDVVAITRDGEDTDIEVIKNAFELTC